MRYVLLAWVLLCLTMSGCSNQQQEVLNNGGHGIPLLGH
jgi:hypothetical protein